MAVLYTNNAQTNLSATISAAATSMSVTAGFGAIFPIIAGGDFFYVTLLDSAGNNEIVKVTARTDDTFTIVRAQDGTTARSWSSGDRVELRLTRALLNQFKLDIQQNFTGNLGFTGTGNRITGDFSNGTPSNRVFVQTSTANSNTFLGVMPNGTSVNAQLQAYNSSDPNNASIAALVASSSQVRIVSGYIGTGTLNPITFIFSNTEAARFDPTTRNFLLGSSTDNGTDKLQVTGSANITGAIKENGNQTLNASNYSSYALPLSGGTLTGKVIAGSSDGDSIEVRNDTASAASSGYITFKNKNGTGVYRPAARISGVNVDNAYDGDFLIETYSGGVAYKGLRVDENSNVLFYDTNGNVKFQWEAVNSRALIDSNVVLHAGNYSSYALPLSGGTITGNIIAANNNVGGVFGNLEIGYGGRYNTLQTKTSADTLWLQYGHAGPIGIGYGGGLTTIHSTAKILGTGVGNPTTADSTDNSILSLRATNALVRLQFGTRNSGNYAGWIQASYDNGGGANGIEPLELNPLGGAVLANGNTVLNSGNYSSYSPSLTGSGASGTWGINVTGYATQLNGYGQQTVYTILDGPANGPVIKVRYDGATANRWIDFGYKDGYGTYYSGLKIYNGDTLTMNGNTVLNASNYSSYAVPLSGGTMSGRLYHNEWIQFNNYTGLYSPNNGAHFLPNEGAYGPWRIYGSRGGWSGIEFGVSNGNVSLMINTDSNTSGFHNNNYGWQFRWNNGTAYVHKNAYGGGTEATVLDSSNYTSYAPSLTGSNASGTWNINITGTAGAIATTGLTSFDYPGYTRWYWSKIAHLNAECNAIIDIQAKTDFNYVPYIYCRASIASWNGSTVSCKLDCLSSYDIPITLYIDNNNDVWVRADAIWHSYFVFNVVVNDGATIYTSSITTSTSAPANSVAIGVGQGVRGTYSAMASASPYSTSNYFGTFNTRSDSYIYSNAILHAGNYSSYALPLGGGTLTGSRPIQLDTGGGSIFIKGDTGGWGMGLYFKGSDNVVKGSFGALGGGSGFSYLWAGVAYDNTWMTFNSSAVNSQVALQQNGNQVLHAGNYTSYALPLSGGTLSATNGPVFIVRKTGSAPGNNTTALFQNDYGDHSWGIVAEFRAGTSGGGDRPSILFSNGYNSTTWSVGFGAADDQFRINQNHGWRNGGWGTERFRIDTGGTPYFNGNVALHAGNYTSYSPSLTGSGASGTWGINVGGQSRAVTLGSYGTSEFTWGQTPSSFAGQNSWASFLISNHGDGSSYYNQTIIMPFWSAPRYSRLEGGTFRGPYDFLTTENYGNYALPLSGGTVSGLTYFTASESIQVNGVRGRFSAGSDGQGIHLFSNVDIGNPNGWGAGLGSTPSRGLSTYGGINVAYGTNAASTFNGNVTFGSLLKIGVDNSDWSTGNYLRGATNHLVIGVQSGGTLYLNYGNEAGTTRISGTTLVNGNQVLHAGNIGSYVVPSSNQDVGAIIMAFSENTYNVMQGATVSGSTLVYPNSNAVYDTSNSMLRMTTNAFGDGAFYAYGDPSYDGMNRTTRISNVFGYSGPNGSGYSYLSGTWRLLSFATGARTWYQSGSVYYSVLYSGLWIRIA